MGNLPSSQELEKLTLRAITAYAVRFARRASVVLAGAADAEVIAAPLRIASKVASEQVLDRSDDAAAARSGAAVAGAMGQLTCGEQAMAALCLVDVAMVVVAVFEAMHSGAKPGWPEGERARAAKHASKCAGRAARAIGGNAESVEILEAARAEYAILLKHFGEHQGVDLGEPVDLSDEWWEKQPR
jgi:hypothetical protein